jgi:hypothetical protein
MTELVLNELIRLLKMDQELSLAYFQLSQPSREIVKFLT